MTIWSLTIACQQEPGRLLPRHTADLSDDRVATPLTLAVVDDSLHVLFANRDTLTLQLARLDPLRNHHTLETIDAVGTYPVDLDAFGVHAYSVHDGRQHVIYVDQQQADALIPKWIQRKEGEELWWVTTPLFDGTPLALLPQPSGDPLIVTATPEGVAVWALSSVSESGRHRPEQMAAHPKSVWPIACSPDADFLALDKEGILSRYRIDGDIKQLAKGVGAYYAACIDGTAHVLWHIPSTGEVLFAALSDDHLGVTTAVTLTRGTSAVYFLWHQDGFSFVVDELAADNNDRSGTSSGPRRIVLIHPEEPHGYRKSVLVDNAGPPTFHAAHVDNLLIIVERREGLIASTYMLP